MSTIAFERPEAGPRSASPAGRRAYWACTLFVALTALGAGLMDLLHMQPLFGLMLHLGYPPYFATVLGVWKSLGAIVLLAPRQPLVKEWAYAGMFIDLSSAVVSHWASGDAATALAGPIVSIGALVGSWYLRPRSRRLGPVPMLKDPMGADPGHLVAVVGRNVSSMLRLSTPSEFAARTQLPRKRTSPCRSSAAP
jgi:hypothetical protein